MSVNQSHSLTFNPPCHQEKNILPVWLCWFWTDERLQPTLVLSVVCDVIRSTRLKMTKMVFHWLITSRSKCKRKRFQAGSELQPPEIKVQEEVAGLVWLSSSTRRFKLVHEWILTAEWWHHNTSSQDYWGAPADSGRKKIILTSSTSSLSSAGLIYSTELRLFFFSPPSD